MTRSDDPAFGHPRVQSRVKSAPAIQLEHLTKMYGTHRGILDVSLDAGAGEIVGFLGPNGAGKTTAIRVLLGFLYPTSGRASILGLDVVRDSLAIRKHVGYLPGDAALYGNRTGGDLLKLSLSARGLASMSGGRDVAERLQAPMDRPIKKCSRGMRQKVALVLTLAHDPDVADHGRTHVRPGPAGATRTAENP